MKLKEIKKTQPDAILVTEREQDLQTQVLPTIHKRWKTESKLYKICLNQTSVKQNVPSKKLLTQNLQAI